MIRSKSGELLLNAPARHSWSDVIAGITTRLLPHAHAWQGNGNPQPLVLSWQPRPQLTVPGLSSVEIMIDEEARPQAFARPAEKPTLSGRIVLSTGLLAMLENESELAFVVAHELAHLEHDHFSPQLPVAMLTSRQLAQIALTHQRWELQADADAVALLRTAGFDPKAAVSLLGRLEQAEANSSQSFVRHHPAMHERIAKLRESSR